MILVVLVLAFQVVVNVYSGKDTTETIQRKAITRTIKISPGLAPVTLTPLSS